MGREGQYDLRLAENISSMDTPDTETEEFIPLPGPTAYNDSHPTRIVHSVSVNLLKIISILSSINEDRIEKAALLNLSSMFRSMVASNKSNAFGWEQMTIFAILRGLSLPRLSIFLTTTSWLKLMFDIIDTPITNENDCYTKIQCVRLLKTNLIYWSKPQHCHIEQTVESIFTSLGNIAFCCPSDISLLQNLSGIKSKVLLSASHSGTIAEELILLLRELQTYPLWTAAINSFLDKKICIAANMFTGKCYADGHDYISQFGQITESEKSLVVAALITIGGYDPRPRIGLKVTDPVSGNEATITSFTQKGKADVTLCDSSEGLRYRKKLTLIEAASNANTIEINFNHMPINEVLLNALVILLSGPCEWKNVMINGLDKNLLHAQQIHLSALKATSKLFGHQISLRKILLQRNPLEPPALYDCEVANVTESYLKEAHVSEHDGYNCENHPDNSELSLFQIMLSRSIRPNPLKSVYSYEELALAAVNILQQLTANIYNNNMSAASQEKSLRNMSQYKSQTMQPTMVHGTPIYNDMVRENVYLLLSATI